MKIKRVSDLGLDNKTQTIEEPVNMVPYPGDGHRDHQLFCIETSSGERLRLVSTIRCTPPLSLPPIVCSNTSLGAGECRHFVNCAGWDRPGKAPLHHCSVRIGWPDMIANIKSIYTVWIHSELKRYHGNGGKDIANASV